MAVPRMRTVEKTVANFKEQDPESGLTITGLRKMLATGEIPFVKVGNKFLINVDIMEEIQICKRETQSSGEPEFTVLG